MEVVTFDGDYFNQNFENVLNEQNRKFKEN